MKELDLGETKSVIEEVERKEGDEAGEGHDLPP